MYTSANPTEGNSEMNLNRTRKERLINLGKMQSNNDEKTYMCKTKINFNFNLKPLDLLFLA